VGAPARTGKALKTSIAINDIKKVRLSRMCILC
jgi:hypothetical protein